MKGSFTTFEATEEKYQDQVDFDRWWSEAKTLIVRSWAGLDSAYKIMQKIQLSRSGVVFDKVDIMTVAISEIGMAESQVKRVMELIR